MLGFLWGTIKVIFAFFLTILAIGFIAESFNLGGIISLIIAVFIFFALIGFLFDTDNRTKCPKCKSKDLTYRVKELDRWRGKSEVQETLASGRKKTRYISVTKVQNRYTYCCEKCQHEFSIVREEER